MLNSMMIACRVLIFGCLVLGWTPSVWSGAGDTVFSGPQVGERLVPFPAKGVLGRAQDKPVDVVQQAGDGPLVLMFVHARTRPAFGLVNVITRYVASRPREEVSAGVIFLTDDMTETARWMNRVQQHFTPDVFHGLSPDGADGPGAYGLNRNVTLTILVGKAGQVTANFALVQPSLQADGPKILQAIVDATGADKVPKLAELTRGRGTGMARMNRRLMQQDPQLGTLLRAVIQREASAEDVEKAVAAVDQYVAANRTAQKHLGRIAATVVNSERLANYGTEPAQRALKQWAETFGPATDRGDADKPREASDPPQNGE